MNGGKAMQLIAIRDHPQYLNEAIMYFQKRWASKDSMRVYEDCLRHSLDTPSPLPRWYILLDGGKVIGGAGLITNDFISRMDLYPWFCALYVEEEYRGPSLGKLLMERAKKDAFLGGFNAMYLCTDHVGYYEKYGFEHIGAGYHPWGDSSRIYAIKLEQA